MPTRMTIQSVEPSLHVVFCSDGLLLDAPVVWKEHRAFNPLSSDMGDEVLKGLCLCFSLQAAVATPTSTVWL